MSPSTRSKPASPSSPATGDGRDAQAGERTEASGAGATAPAPAGAAGTVAIELEVSRAHAASWAVFGLLFGALLIWKLGTVGQWVGVVLMVVGAFRLWELVQTLRYPPGTITVAETEVTLPRGLCLPRPVQVAPADVTAVYFLRRSVPWNRSAPVLVVEVGGRAIAYPRDWFASEADQRHIVHALLRGLGGSTGEGRRAVEDADKLAGAQVAAGLALTAVGVLAWVTSSSPVGAPGALHTLFVAPIVAGALLAWRGIARW